ncbi:hypothetical protein AHF37_10211, partial [Paragonimus kellicotti]
IIFALTPGNNLHTDRAKASVWHTESVSSSHPGFEEVSRRAGDNLQNQTRRLSLSSHFWHKRPSTSHGCDLASSYSLRLRAVNRVGHGPFSDWVKFDLETESSGIKQSLKLRRIIIQESNNASGDYGRALLSWKANDASMTHSKAFYQIKWFQIDPVTLDIIGPSLTRSINWPQAITGGASHEEVLIAIDKLLVGAVYEFKIENADVAEMRCSEFRTLRAYILPDQYLSAPYRHTLPHLCSWMDSTDTYNQQSRPNYDAVIQCRTASVKLAWPAYSASLVQDGATVVDTHYGPIYTSPITNYSLAICRNRFIVKYNKCTIFASCTKRLELP